MSGKSTERQDGRPVLVTGAGGFVGGHVARALASAGVRVRALSRRPVAEAPGDPRLEWLVGDIRRGDVLDAAVEGARTVVHTAGWVSLGPDRKGESRRVNVGATEGLLDRCGRAGVERLVYTSTLWTVAAGTADRPADEGTPWNLDAVRCPYSDTKREAEQLVLGRNGPGLATVVLCPGLVVGPRDVRPTSTGLFLRMARTRVAVLPKGGIPLVDVGVVALAHLRALERGRPGARYVVAGPYLSYPEMAALVARIAGRPRFVVEVPDRCERPLRGLARLAALAKAGRAGELSAAAVSGGFLRLHVSGALADREFDLDHPDPLRSVFEALEDHRRYGRAPWLGTLRPPGTMGDL
jgi:dihydroflavonol-4-reductase